MNFHEALLQMQGGKYVTCDACPVVVMLQPNVVPLLINGEWQIAQFTLVAYVKKGEFYAVNAPWSFSLAEQNSTDWSIVTL